MIVEYLSVFLIVLNLILLSSSRLGVCIRAVTAQGIILGILPLVEEWGNLHTSTIAVAIVTLLLKGGVFPYLLGSAAGRAGVKREIEPLVSYTLSLIVGVAMLIFSFWLQSRLPVRAGVSTPLLLPAAFFSIMAGFFMTIARRKALTQVLGYLALENGIYAFGASMLSGHPWLFELGILLDVFVAVFVMGIAVFHISREFSHTDAYQLSSLRDISEEGAS
jgi:Hydrogenase 4 membrane component (E)